MPRTPGRIHYSPDLSRHGHQLVYGEDSHVVLDTVCYRRTDEENKANAARVVECWNACESMQQPEVAVAWARNAIALVLADISYMDDKARNQILEETLRALETAASALGKKP